MPEDQTKQRTQPTPPFTADESAGICARLRALRNECDDLHLEVVYADGVTVFAVLHMMVAKVGIDGMLPRTPADKEPS